MKTPKYRKHSSRDFGFVEWQGERVRLPGRWNSAESKAAYKSFLLKNCNQALPVAKPAPQGMVVMELLVAYLQHLLIEEGGRSDIYQVQSFAIKPFAAEYGHELAATFGPLNLKQWQNKLASKGLARAYISSNISYIRTAFRWGVSEELIPASVWHSMQSVKALKAGKSMAKEAKKRMPIPYSFVETLVPFLTPTVRAMVLLQWYSGVRSMSICSAARNQFVQDGEFLLWSPKLKRNAEVTLPLGPRAQEVLRPFMADTADRFLFNPRTVSKHRRYGEKYRPRSYYRCVRAGIDRMNKALTATCTPTLPPWMPHQMRHSKGHLVRAMFGLEAVAATLAHAKLSTSEIYSDKRMDLARLVAKETG